MLQTIKDACKFDPRAIDYALSDQIENLDDLIGHDPKEAEAFFRKTYVTGGMKTLLRQGLQRLSGTSGQAVFELKQAMGGGKTHSMLALGYLAANPKLFGLVAKDITQGIKAEPAQVVAISGRSISRDKHLWGDIASQLGKADKFVEFYKGAPLAPNEKDWIDLIGDAPTLTDAEGVKATMRGIRRTIGSARVRKAPAVAAKMLGMVATAPDKLAGLRDRALLLLGFAGAFRRSELVALDVADVEETEAGLRVTIRRSKTDQEGQGVTIAIARGDVACPVKALRAWLGAAGIEAGPLFRSINKAGRVAQARLTDRSVANIVKVYAERAGFDASTFSGHSLRSGFLTSAAAKGASIFKMMDVSGHKSVETLRGYVRDAEIFKDHAGAGLL